MRKLDDIYSIITAYCEENSVIKKGDKILVALSGGADSVFLLLYLIYNKYDIEAAHCNFHLRKEESMRDEQFVRNLCDKLKIKLHVKDFNTEAVANAKEVSIEMAARELRYNWFGQLLDETGCTSVAVAHHKDDNVETLLLNLIRGTGLKGLKGMRPVNGHIIRPLLCIRRQDIINGLNEIGQGYVTDSTNNQNVYSRNKIRLDVLPLLRSINAAADENIATTIENLSEAYNVYQTAVNKDIASCLDDKTGTMCIDKAKLLNCTSPISVLHTILDNYGFNRVQAKSILRCNETGKQFHSPSSTVLIDRNTICIFSKDGEKHVVINEPLISYNGIECRMKSIDNLTISKKPNYAYIDADKISGNLIVRNVNTGDTFIPFGMKGKKLISDFLTDMKLNLFEKKSQLVVCDDNNIVWVVGKRISDLYRIDPDTQNVLIMYVRE